MCNECCKVFKGWCKSFTGLEIFLSVLEGALLLTFLCLFFFVVVHCATCAKQELQHVTNIIKEGTTQQSIHEQSEAQGSSLTTNSSTYDTTIATTAGKQCSWTPSARTEPRAVYYDTSVTASKYLHDGTNKYSQQKDTTSESTNSSYVSNAEDAENTDAFVDDELLDFHKKLILALVKFGPSKEIEFGCILTTVTEYWTVTAASCIESVAAGGLDGFVMAESEATAADGPRHALAAVRRCPSAGCDVAALRSASVIVIAAGRPRTRLPTHLDRVLTTMGETFTVLDYEKVRSSGRTLRRARAVAAAPAAARCGAAPAPGADDAFGALCVMIIGAGDGAGWAECRVARGRPLLRARTLLAVQAAGGSTGGAGDCDGPSLFASLAPARHWLDDLIRSNSPPIPYVN